MCKVEIMSLSDNTRAVVRERKTTLFKSYKKYYIYIDQCNQNITQAAQRSCK
uniref:Uncharacterized protein n=1 Tax=Arundo donax TaxID=35708 RepID=A0A0A9DAL6_ARUDO